MESLADETWDVVIAGTGLVQALLALSLSRSDLKILHVDKNSYYGGDDAGLSLDEAEAWANTHNDESSSFSSARILQSPLAESRLRNSRAYTLSLNPQIVYAQSAFLPSLVSSTVNSQLEFMAVGSWWIFKQNTLKKIPSSREDVFADDSLSRRDKIGLMKFLRYVVSEKIEEGGADDSQQQPQQMVLEGESLQSALSSKFKISEDLQIPLSALALTPQSIHETKVEVAVPRIRKHMRSMGYFGPGFGAVVAKYGSNAEIAQVCCRACAVGGATYLLGHGVSDAIATNEDELVDVTLTSGVTVKSKFLIGSLDTLPSKVVDDAQSKSTLLSRICRSVNIISSPLRQLFPATSENGPVPAAAIVLVDDHEAADSSDVPPIYLQIHSEDTGECPSGQCIIYASTLLPDDTETASVERRLAAAVHKFVGTEMDTESVDLANSTSHAEVLWTMSYVSHGLLVSESVLSEDYVQNQHGRILTFGPRKHDIAFDDGVLEQVKAVWRKILGDTAEGIEFLRFEERTGLEDDD